MTTQTLNFHAVRAKQSNRHTVVSFAATAGDVLRFARIQRAGRAETGDLFGFQRPQIAGHVREIRDYMARADAVIPNSIVVAFVAGDGGVRIDGEGDVVSVSIDLCREPKGLVVDGQQRLSALAGLPESNMQLFVSLLLCEDEKELRRQFILINNTRPLPKGLIYELLPSVDGLPGRLSVRTLAAGLTDKLNYRGGPLKGEILQHTNPHGRIKDTAVQRLVMNSLNDGAMRELISRSNGESECLRLANVFFMAVAEVFADEWVGHTPKTSRLVHSAGIVAMGYVMEHLYARQHARTFAEFRDGLKALVGCTAWTAGSWAFGAEDRRPWNRVQNTNRDIRLLTDYLLRVLKQGAQLRAVGDKAPLAGRW